MRTIRQPHFPKSGLSLLEVVLAIAILGVSMVAIVELLNVGYRAAISGRLRTEAALLCDAKMAEIAAGALAVQSSGMSSMPENPNWNFSVDVQPSIQLGLLTVTVTVRQSSNSTAPISMSIVRFMPDPDFNPDEAP
ncbi:MAG: prepilin-type N-terminal cleavage/methylation domain-containing protein [Pirellulaceae bacterium]|nr:prepilin-type N-terminal cleavage/methylation domain-containing protein [Pirellulaceae bacterium]